MDLQEILAKHGHITPFALAAARLADDCAPITRFVASLKIRPVWSTAEVRAFYNQAGPNRTGGHSHRELAGFIPEYGAFLASHGFHANRDEPADPAAFVHDAIGHIALRNPVTPLGELCACAGVAGFSSTVGIDYFINALLLFSLGYRLFDDVPSAKVAITPEVATVIDAAYGAGIFLAEVTDYSDRGKYDTLVFVVDEWVEILQKCRR